MNSTYTLVYLTLDKPNEEHLRAQYTLLLYTSLRSEERYLVQLVSGESDCFRLYVCLLYIHIMFLYIAEGVHCNTKIIHWQVCTYSGHFVAIVCNWLNTTGTCHHQCHRVPLKPRQNKFKGLYNNHHHCCTSLGDLVNNVQSATLF